MLSTCSVHALFVICTCSVPYVLTTSWTPSHITKMLEYSYCGSNCFKKSRILTIKIPTHMYTSIRHFTLPFLSSTIDFLLFIIHSSSIFILFSFYFHFYFYFYFHFHFHFYFYFQAFNSSCVRSSGSIPRE